MRRLARPLLYGGTAASVLGFSRYHASAIGHYSWHSSPRAAWTVAFIAVLCVAAYAVGLPELYRSARRGLLAGIAAAGAAAIAISLAQLVLGSALLPRFVIFASSAVVVPWFTICALLADDARSIDEDRARVVAVVRAEEAATLTAELERAPEKSAMVVAMVEPDRAKPAMGSLEQPLVQVVADSHANVVVLDRAAQDDDAIVAQAASLHEAGVRIRTLTLFYDDWLGKLPVSELERVSLMFDIGEVHRVRYGRIKRICDVVAGLVGLVAVAVAIPFVLIGNCFGNRGPLFYSQARVGRGGRPFKIVKFRSMRTAPVLDRTTSWTTDGDSRITTLGRWLRRTHLDELPQAWNLLKGEQSLVGPRPEQPCYVDELSSKIPFYDLRHLVRPGLTGWAQVKYAYGSSEADALEKLQYEFWYLRHQGLLLDARIVARTLRSVLRGSGR